ncbi:MAG: preprotein translocase subunit SecG [Bacteroidota bacterium]
MYTILVFISIIVSIMLILVVLLQSSKGGGLAGSFGGAGQFGTVFGTRRTADFLSKSTWWLGGSLLILAIIINLFFLPGQSQISQKESIIQGGKQQSVPTTPVLPQQRTAPLPEKK